MSGSNTIHPLPQLLAPCEEFDAELGATLLHILRPTAAMELDEELVLF